MFKLNELNIKIYKSMGNLQTPNNYIVDNKQVNSLKIQNDLENGKLAKFSCQKIHTYFWYIISMVASR